MRTPVIILLVFSLFYFASSCKKGDGGNVVPPYDSTHYNDSVKHVTDSVQHVTDSVAHVADSIYKLPWGIYYGDVQYAQRDEFGNSNSGDFLDTFLVSRVAGDSISFLSMVSRTGKTFLYNPSGHYLYELGPYPLNYSYGITVGGGSLTVSDHYQYGGTSGEYDNYDFGGTKKK